MGVGVERHKAQIALEFIVVYSFVLLVFLVFYALIINQRAATLNSQGYSTIQLISQSVADYISQAVYSGSGYNVTVPLVGSVGVISYNLSISTTGVVIASIRQGSQVTTAEAFSAGRNLVINGTQIGPSNSIGIYSISTLGGSLRLYNYHGIIYINEAPAPIGNLTGSVFMQTMWDDDSAYFNKDSVITVPDPSTRIQDPDLYPLSISFWIDPSANQIANYPALVLDGSPTNSMDYEYLIYLQNPTPGQPANNIVRFSSINFKYLDSSNTPHDNLGAVATSNEIYADRFAMITYVFNYNDLYVYVNGQLSNSVVGLPPLKVNTAGAERELWFGDDGLGNLNYYDGFMANMQIYNRTLSAGEVEDLYGKGVFGAPVNSSGIVGYWNFDVRTLDISGNGNTGTPTNIIYNQTLEFVVQGHSVDESTELNGSLVGVMSNYGSLGADGNTLAMNLTAGGMNNTVFIAYPPTKTANVMAVGYNGNATARAELAGWWPLTEGAGAYIHDLSGKDDGGSATKVTWAPLTNATDFAPGAFPGAPNNDISSSTVGFITMNQVSADNAIIANNTFTAVAWIYDEGASGHVQGLFDGLGGSAKGGFGINAEGGCTSGGQVLTLPGGNALNWPTGGNCGGMPMGTWEMETGQYNGRTGEAMVYLNDTLYNSTNLGGGLSFSGTGKNAVGDAYGAKPNGGDGFNGMITDVQLYSEQLTPAQIGYLYDQGATGVPIGDAGLVSWWPLDGSASDFGLNNDSGAITDNVLFNNVAYFANNASATTFGAKFNGVNSIVSVPDSNAIDVSGPIAIGAWVYINGLDGGGSGQQQIMVKEDAYGILINDEGYVQFGDDLGTCKPCIETGISLLPGRWYYIFGVYNGTVGQTSSAKNTAVYINGQAQAATYTGGKWTATGGVGNPLYIGDDYTFMKPFNGTVVDVQVYNGIITSQQVEQLYEAGLPPQSSVSEP